MYNKQKEDNLLKVLIVKLSPIPWKRFLKNILILNLGLSDGFFKLREFVQIWKLRKFLNNSQLLMHFKDWQMVLQL